LVAAFFVDDLGAAAVDLGDLARRSSLDSEHEMQSRYSVPMQYKNSSERMNS
jgi:hypothetical protein